MSFFIENFITSAPVSFVQSLITTSRVFFLFFAAMFVGLLSTHARKLDDS